MNNKLVSNDNIQQIPPNWNHIIIPGNAKQGSLLMTINDFIEPPQDMANFKWKPLEDLANLAKIRLDYNEELNRFTLLQAKGHLNNDDNWAYEWNVVGEFENITKEAQQALKDLVYVSYEYDTSINNKLKVFGVKKNGNKVLLCDIDFVSATVLETAIQNITEELNRQVNTLNYTIDGERERATGVEELLDGKIQSEIERATQREDELEEMIEAQELADGIATEVVLTQEEKKAINVKVDNDTIEVNDANELKAKITKYNSGVAIEVVDTLLDNQKEVSVKVDNDTIKVNNNNQLYANVNYEAGTGIEITPDRVINATGIAFQVGEGLEVVGSGSTAKLQAKISEGLSIDETDDSVKVNVGKGIAIDTDDNIIADIGAGLQFNSSNKTTVKPQNSKGIVVDANGVGVKIDDSLLFNSNGNIGTKNKYNFTNGLKDTLTEQQDGTIQHLIEILTNFNIKTTPLGNADSKLSLYSDGKIAVDTENVVLGGDLLASFNIPVGRNYITNGNIPNLSKYDMLYIVHRGLFGEYLQKPAATTTVRASAVLPNVIGDPGSTPSGAAGYMILIRDLNPTAETFSRLDLWAMQTWGTWTQAQASATSTRIIDIYGMRTQ